MTHNKKLKIALVIERFDPQGGGAERSTDQMAKELVKRGHRVTVFAGHIPKNVQVEPYEIRRLWEKKKRSALGLLAFSKWASQEISRGDFDISLSLTTAVACDIIEPRSGTIKETLIRNAVTKGKWLGLVKKISDGLSFKRRALLSLEKKVLHHPHVKCLIALSSYVEQQVQRHYDFPPEKITIVPNAASLPTISPTQREAHRQRLRQEMNLKPETVAFLFAAHNPMLKGAGPLLAALKNLKSQNDDVAIIVAGNPCSKMKRRVAQLDLMDCVRFIGNVSDMAAMYCAVDVTVHPTFYDPSSKVVIESLMMKVPAISTRYNGASDFIEPVPGHVDYGKLRGRVIDQPDDIPALSQAMAQLIDPKERQRCANDCNALDRGLSMIHHIDRVEEILYQVDANKKN